MFVGLFVGCLGKRVCWSVVCLGKRVCWLLRETCLLVCCLLNFPATCQCISGADLLNQVNVLDR